MGELKPIIITSAAPLSEATRKKVETTFTAKHKGETVTFVYAINPTVLGGVLVNDNENYYDGTLKAQLEKVKKLL